MDFNGFTLPDLTPRIDTSFIDEMNRRNQEMLDSITPLNEILAEEIKPILEGNQKVVEGLNDKPDEYEIISGHRRVHAAELLEIKEVPAVVHFIDRPGHDFNGRFKLSA